MVLDSTATLVVFRTPWCGTAEGGASNGLDVTADRNSSEPVPFAFRGAP